MRKSLKANKKERTTPATSRSIFSKKVQPV
nr:MAG TPA: hypothetical protein [Siphoviridae sp. ctngg6]